MGDLFRDGRQAICPKDLSQRRSLLPLQSGSIATAVFWITRFGKLLPEKFEVLFVNEFFHEPAPLSPRRPQWPWALGCLPHNCKAVRLKSKNYGDGQLRAFLWRNPVHSPIRVIVLRIADKCRSNGSLNHIFRIIPHRALHGRDLSSAQFIVHRHYRSAAEKFPLTTHRPTCPSVCFLGPPNYDKRF